MAEFLGILKYIIWNSEKSSESDPVKSDPGKGSVVWTRSEFLIPSDTVLSETVLAVIDATVLLRKEE